LVLQHYGLDGLAELHDYFCALTRLMWRKSPNGPVRGRPRARVEHSLLSVRGPSSNRRNDEALDQLNRELRERYNTSGGLRMRGPISMAGACYA
jgi:hypothetical protein